MKQPIPACKPMDESTFITYVSTFSVFTMGRLYSAFLIPPNFNMLYTEKTKFIFLYDKYNEYSKYNEMPILPNFKLIKFIGFFT